MAREPQTMSHGDHILVVTGTANIYLQPQKVPNKFCIHFRISPFNHSTSTHWKSSTEKVTERAQRPVFRKRSTNSLKWLTGKEWHARGTGRERCRANIWTSQHLSCHPLDRQPPEKALGQISSKQLNVCFNFSTGKSPSRQVKQADPSLDSTPETTIHGGGLSHCRTRTGFIWTDKHLWVSTDSHSLKQDQSISK